MKSLAVSVFTLLLPVAAAAQTFSFEAAVGQALGGARQGFAAAREAKAARKGAPARLRYSEKCILEAVAGNMGIKLKDEVPVPQVFVESQTPLERFQDAVEPQWNMRPDMFLNVYVFQSNQIYLMDDSSYYDRLKRAIDDSLAHELVHYLQVKYKGYRPEDFDDSAEGEAVSHQSWFRDNYIHQSPPEGFCKR